MSSDVHGTCAEAFEPLRDLLAAELASGEELGAAVCVDVDGETVVDLWGGWADQQRTRPWQADTIVTVWSVTKTVTNLAALRPRGPRPARRPRSGRRLLAGVRAAGKGAVEVRHLLGAHVRRRGLGQAVRTRRT
jgi:hypothetical protein